MNQLFVIIFIGSAIALSINSKQPDDGTNFPQLSYKKHILPIIEKNCSMCHNIYVPEMNWLDYNTAFKKRDRIKSRLQDKSMPIGVIMLESERKMMIDWVNGGARP